MAEHYIPSVSELWGDSVCLSFNHYLLLISGPYPRVSIPSSSPRPDRMWPPGEGLDISIWSWPWLEAAGWGMPLGVSPRLAACKLGFFPVDDRVCSLRLCQEMGPDCHLHLSNWPSWSPWVECLRMLHLGVTLNVHVCNNSETYRGVIRRNGLDLNPSNVLWLLCKPQCVYNKNHVQF